MRIGQRNGRVSGALGGELPKQAYLFCRPSLIGQVVQAQRQTRISEKRCDIEALRSERARYAAYPGG